MNSNLYIFRVVSHAGYRYGKSLVPITDDDEAQMKVSSERCFSVLGFTPQSCIKHHQIVGTSVQVVVPPPGDDVSGISRASLSFSTSSECREGYVSNCTCSL